MYFEFVHFCILFKITHTQNGVNRVDVHWLQSSRAISGLFGMSLNLDDNPNTVRHPLGIENARYALMPNEFVCTENLVRISSAFY